MKFKVKIRVSSPGRNPDKVSFHLDDGSKFVLGRHTPGIHLDFPTVAESHCTLSIENGEMFVTDGGSGKETKLNRERVRSRVVHVGDILEVGEATIEFLEVPFKADQAETSHTQFLDLSAQPSKRDEPVPTPKNSQKLSKKQQKKWAKAQRKATSDHDANEESEAHEEKTPVTAAAASTPAASSNPAKAGTVLIPKRPDSMAKLPQALRPSVELTPTDLEYVPKPSKAPFKWRENGWLQMGIGTGIATVLFLGYQFVGAVRVTPKPQIVAEVPDNRVPASESVEPAIAPVESPPEISPEAKRVIEREQRVTRPVSQPAVQSVVQQIPQAQVPIVVQKPTVQMPVKNRASELVEAASQGDMRLVQNLLFEERVDVDSRTLFGETALMAASAKGQMGVIRLLIDKGAQVNLVDSEGNGAVMYAIRGGQSRLVSFLVVNGASTRMRNRHGDTPLTLARRYNRQEIVRFLQGRGVASGTHPANSHSKK